MFDYGVFVYIIFFFFKQKTAYEMRISDWSSDVCSSDLDDRALFFHIVDEPPDTARRARAIGAAERVVVGAGAALDRGARNLDERGEHEIGRASCRERVCQYV